MKRLIRGCQIDITLFPIQSEELMDLVVQRMNRRFDEEKNDPILGYIRNGKFYTLNLEHTEVESDHYSLKCLYKYEDKFWLVLNKHPGCIYNPVSYLTGWSTAAVEEYDIWTDERSNSYIAVVTGIDCD